LNAQPKPEDPEEQRTNIFQTRGQVGGKERYVLLLLILVAVLIVLASHMLIILDCIALVMLDLTS